MAIATYTKTGTKAATPAKLDKKVFDVTIKNHQLLKSAYLAYQANGRTNLAVTKKRGQVRGGGKKPWRQKGTGRARFGSSRNPIWRGGGISFGPTGNENYSMKLNTKSKRTAISHALTLAAQTDAIIILEDLALATGKTSEASKLFTKIGATGSVLVVTSGKDDKISQATNNLPKIKLVSASQLTVFDLLNSDKVVLSKPALEHISEWLGSEK